MIRTFADARVLELVAQVIAPVVQHGNTWCKTEQDLPLGCSLSPLLAEFYLAEMDAYFAKNNGWHYQRFADDILLLAKSNHSLKRGIRKVRTFLHEHWLAIRYYKTFVGRLSQVVTYLGYRFFPTGAVGVSREALAKARLNRLRRESQGASETELRSYWRRWERAFRLVAAAG